MAKKIGIIGIRGLPAKYGAFDTFVELLVTNPNVLNSKISALQKLKINLLSLFLINYSCTVLRLTNTIGESLRTYYVVGQFCKAT